MEKPLKIQEEIINQARKLDKSRNQDALRVAKRNKGHFIREMIEQLLLDIRSISPQKREKECEMNVFLSLSDTMEDDREMRIQETQSVTRKFFLEKKIFVILRQTIVMPLVRLGASAYSRNS